MPYYNVVLTIRTTDGGVTSYARKAQAHTASKAKWFVFRRWYQQRGESVYDLNVLQIDLTATETK